MTKEDALKMAKKECDMGVCLLHIPYIDITGDMIAGLVLSQIVYWCSPDSEGKTKLRVKKKGELWLAKSRADWYKELRISSKHVNKALKRLKELGLIEKELFRFGGSPTVHIKLNMEILNQKMKEWIEHKADEILENESGKPIKSTIEPNGTNPIVQNGSIQLSQMGETLTETTTRITIPETTISESDRVGNCKDVPDSQEDEFSFSVLDRQIKTVCKDIGKEKYAEGIIFLFHKYYNFFEIKMLQHHKKLTNENIEDAILRLSEFYLPMDQVEAHRWYTPMIYEYFYGNNKFTGNENGECDYSILHFISTLEYREYNYEKTAYI